MQDRVDVGAGRQQAEDVGGAIQTRCTEGREHRRTAALQQEIAPARGAHPALDRAAERALAGIHTLADEAQARRLARDIALLLQAALLQRDSPAVFSAFCASRLDGAADVFGLLPAGTDFDAILRRAMPSLH